MFQVRDDISRFMASVASGEIDIYNEFSLQHELGLFLRHQYPDCKVQFERNVAHFFGMNEGFTKREIDISVCTRETNSPLLAIELKFPRNGQYPEQMFSFCKDIAFAEELCAAGFQQAVVVVVVDDPLFYQGAATEIYAHFRGQTALTGTIRRPTGARDTSVSLKGRYQVEWQQSFGPMKYAIFVAN